MKSFRIQLDEATYRALNRVAPAAQRQRAELGRRAIREAEQERTRLAYLRQPDSEAEIEDWFTSCKETAQAACSSIFCLASHERDSALYQGMASAMPH